MGEFLPPLSPVAEPDQKPQVEVIGEIIAAKEAVNRISNISGAPEEKRESREVKTTNPERKHLPTDKTRRIIYRVKKGDTLAAIAKRHGTTVPALAKLNRLKLSKPLYVDRKLIIPGKPAP
ncbi:MAG: hypothetical protein ACD_75C02343G0001 [uncultured bacterium]|nr:MAG: hypothetical protein ACD_75C02343G0001 [uncultured bacterium]